MTIILKRPSANKQGEQSSAMRPLVFLAIALGAVILLSKDSLASPSTVAVAATEEKTSSLRHRQATEESGKTFVFEVAGLTDGTTGEVVIQTHPEWAPLGVKVRRSRIKFG